MAFIAARNVGALVDYIPTRETLRGRPFEIPWINVCDEAILGIDPGLSGAIVGLSSDGSRVLGAFMMPTRAIGGRGRIKRRIDGEGLNGILRRPNIVHAFVEDPGVVMGGHGGTAITSPLSVAALHATLGAIEATLDAIRVPHTRCHAITWKKPFGLLGKKKKASISVAAAVWPSFAHLRVRDNGIADAAMIAEYGRTFTRWR